MGAGRLLRTLDRVQTFDERPNSNLSAVFLGDYITVAFCTIDDFLTEFLNENDCAYAGRARPCLTA